MHQARICIAILLGMLVACSKSPSATQSSTPNCVPNIPVVRSIDELKNQPTVTADGIPVRIGIQSTVCPNRSGVLVYCLWTPVECNRASNAKGDRQLGPLHIRILHSEKIIEFTHVFDDGQIHSSASPILNATAVYCYEPGDFQVELRTNAGILIAQTKVHVKNDNVHPWLHFQTVEYKLTADDLDINKTVTIGTLSGLPIWSGSDPMSLATFPTYIPQKTDPDFTLAFDRGILRLTSKHFITTDFGDHFLAHWWVNGQPAHITLVPMKRETIVTEGVRASHEPVVLEWELLNLANSLHAKPGDRIQVQVMYALHDWDELSRDDKSINGDPATIYINQDQVRLSNVVTFPLPENPVAAP